ncbi:MAG: hypothetical protein QG578_146 [Thermodesulfobacteriota bacterium]|nr:hypothetical protein [Thermodesulfobacteriota bacterium]
MFSATNLIAGIITGAFGLGYYVYGKKQSRMIFMFTGIALMVYPYLFANSTLLIVIGLILILLPFVFRD